MSNQQMQYLNEQLYDQTSRLRKVNRTANETQETQNNIMRELGDQRQKIDSQITTSNNIKQQLRSVGKTTNEMRTRNSCMKIILYLLILLLFLANVGVIISKVLGKSN